MTDPVLLVVDHDPRELVASERALRRRYGADYRVLAERSPEAALELLERLVRRGEDVAPSRPSFGCPVSTESSSSSGRTLCIGA